MKPDLREKAIQLRRKGFTYSEILEQVPVAKSTLSLWLRSVGLSKKQKQRITAKKLASARRGAEAKRQQRLLKTEKIQNKAKSDVGKISRREFWLMGTMLYWAEGTKEKEWNPGIGVEFMNSDAEMVKLFLKWLTEVCDVDRNRIRFKLHIHENHRHRLGKVKSYWSEVTGFNESEFSNAYFKKHNPKTNRKNVDKDYWGTLSIQVKASSTLNRRIAGWVKGVIESPQL